MAERMFYAPWDDIQVKASFIERHCAFCRVLELDYKTAPGKVYEVLASASKALRTEAIETMHAAVERLPKMFAWHPPEYEPDQKNPFARMTDGGMFDHYAVFGGRGGAKSFDAADAIVELASTRKERVAGAREFMKRIKESSKEVLDNKIKESPWAADWEITEFEMKNKRTGSQIIFIGLTGSNAESVGKALEGVSILWADEAQLLTQHSIDIILPTIRMEGSRCIWTWNPGEEPSAVDLLFRGDSPPERSLVQCRLVEDNPYLYRTRLAAEMRSSFQRDSADKFNHIWRGAHLEITEATIFPNISVDHLNWLALPNDGDCDEVIEIAGMDFGYGGDDPSAAVKAYVIMPSALPGFKPDAGMRPVLYIRSEAVERAVPNHELWRLAKATGGMNFLCDSAMPLMISALEASGEVSARPAVKGPGSLVAGIRKLQSCDIMIDPRCPVAEQEFRNLKWAVDPKTGKVRRPLSTVGEDHIVAAVRYAISETELTELQSGGVSYA
ncbi:hypothetical protein GCM10011360_02660 [Primorskyibacter flagellatus]|uniref:Phage terminase large subunit n=1 Tax=Primorskyibacter flagellatus TaxID=1387277 RepID=A0A917E9Y3_9RHOB|nr:phage terminase large subunit [Primorskyibacter flagellatus]GGE17309.1 hypothetical protein GCM10011360_02660 [Primorskyibacter flagellatus]